MKRAKTWCMALGFFAFVFLAAAILIILPFKRVTTAERLAAFPKELPLTGAATVYWSKHQVPFIQTATDDDAAFLWGMAHAHLRLGQMALIRKIAYGRLSEALGPWTVKVDHLLRALHFSKHAESSEATLPLQTKLWLLKYVEGINFYLAHAQTLPREYRYFGLDENERWSVKDILTISRMMGADFNWGAIFSFVTHQSEAGFKDYWKNLVGLNDLGADGLVTDFLQNLTRAGSNSWVLGSRKTVSGKPMLVGDPHLGLSLPSFWVLMGLYSPSYHMVGLSIPSVPAIAIGRNKDIAWGGTNMHAWSTDLVDVGEDKSGKWPQRIEKVKVRFGFDKRVTVTETPWGPLVNNLDFLNGKKLKKSLALKWMGAEPSDEISALLSANRSKNWSEFQKSFDHYNVVGIFYTYADRFGNTGMIPAVKLPQRKTYDRLIYDPVQDPDHWKNSLNYNRPMAIFNPPSAVIASSNNAPSKDPRYRSPFFASSNRHDRIVELLGTKKRWESKDMLALQKDTFSKGSFLLAQKFLKVFSTESPLPSWFNELKTWDGFFSVESRGALIFSLIVHEVATEIYQNKVSKVVLEKILSSHSLVEWMNEAISSIKFDSKKLTFIQQRVARSLHRYKNFGEYHSIRLAHPIGLIPWLGQAFVFRDLAWPGTIDSVMKSTHSFADKKTNSRFGAEARYIFDMSDLNQNKFMLLGGQDGWFGSDNFHDLVDLWLKDEWLEVPMDLKKVKETFAYKMEFAPTILH